jgi:DNA invertase Pin-like site-specific DNA recombinase
VGIQASLFEDLIRWKVNLISLKDGLDLVTPAGRLMANILAGVAAYETEVRAERIRAGQAAARERGIRAARSEAVEYVPRSNRSQSSRA